MLLESKFLGRSSIFKLINFGMHWCTPTPTHPGAHTGEKCVLQCLGMSSSTTVLQFGQRMLFSSRSF